MIQDINDKLDAIEHHLDNIRELVIGTSDKGGKLILTAITQAECSLRIAHSYMVDPLTIDHSDDARWEV